MPPNFPGLYMFFNSTFLKKNINLIIAKFENDLDRFLYHKITKSHKDILIFRVKKRPLNFERGLKFCRSPPWINLLSSSYWRMFRAALKCWFKFTIKLHVNQMPAKATLIVFTNPSKVNCITWTKRCCIITSVTLAT